LILRRVVIDNQPTDRVRHTNPDRSVPALAAWAGHHHGRVGTSRRPI
jgi:hypothetical protein